MKIGIFLTNYTPHAGGAFTFETEIAEAIKRVTSKYEFIFFYYGDQNSIEIFNTYKFVSIKRRSQNDKTILNASSGFSKFKKWLNLLGFGRFRAALFPLYSKVKILEHDLNELKNKIYLSSNSYDTNNPLNDALLQSRVQLVWFLNHYFEPVEVPFVTTVFDVQHRLQPFFPEVSVTGALWQDRENHFIRTLARATYIITGTHAGREEISHFYGIPNQRIKVIPFPAPSISEIVNKNDLSSIAPIKRNHFLFYPAQFWPHKNHILILSALKKLKDKYQINLNVIFTGSDKGNREYVEKKVEEFDLGKQVFFLGFVEKKDLVLLYKNALALVFPSYFGPDNIPPLEAFSLGCPVIASDVSGAKEQLGDAALLFDPASADQLAQAVLKIINDLAVRDILIEKGYQRVKHNLPTDYVRSMIQIIEEFRCYRETWSFSQSYAHL